MSLTAEEVMAEYRCRIIVAMPGYPHHGDSFQALVHDLKTVPWMIQNALDRGADQVLVTYKQRNFRCIPNPTGGYHRLELKERRKKRCPLR